MRPRRFSSPSIYLALRITRQFSLLVGETGRQHWPHTYPFGGFRFFSTCVKTHSVL